MNSQKILLILSLTGCLALMGVSPASAQTQAKGRISQDFIYSAQKKFQNHVDNIPDMIQGASETDYVLGHELYSIALNFADNLAHLSDLYFLHENVINKVDKEIIARLLRKKSEFVSKIAGNYVKKINHELTYASTPLLISEGEHIRDDIRNMQEKLKSFSP